MLSVRRGIERHRFAGSGYHLEIAEVTECVRAGLHESTRLPLDRTLAVMTTLDDTRTNWTTNG